jgi:Protein of unknown function (DUF2892)
MGFAAFMSSPAGRIVRVVAGLALIGGGAALALSATNVVLGVVLAVVGLVPFFAGTLDVCVFAPLFGAPFSGAKVRAHAAH